MSDLQPSNPQSDPHGSGDPPDVNDRPSAAQTLGQTVTGLSAAAIFLLVATPLGVILACLALFLVTRGG
jgi:hypothetical protein